jgi:DNA polymerase IV
MHHFPPRPLRWLFLDLNSYFASVEQQLNPQLRGKPIIVTPLDSESTCAIAASYEAKKFGIKTGTPVWEARQKCPGLQIVNAQHGRYVEFHEAIVAEIWRHIPVTHICSIDEVACHLMDNENSVAAATALAGRIKRGIMDNVGACLTSSVGIAPSRMLAKFASDMMKPDGLTVLQAEELPDRLYQYPLSDICGIGRNMERRLAAKGITSIRQFCALGPRGAGRVWGANHGDRLWFGLHGVDLPDTPTQSRSLGHSHVLSPELRDPQGTLMTARRLALKAASRLRRKEYTASVIVLHAKFETTKMSWAKEIKVIPAQDSFEILAAVDALWPYLLRDGSRQPGGFRVKMIGITLGRIAPVNTQQGSLLDLLEAQEPAQGDPDKKPTHRQKNYALSVAMDHINTRFGRDAVSVGPLREGAMKNFGTKIAFGRIPSMAEFHE